MRIPKRAAIATATALAVVSMLAAAFVVFTNGAHAASTEPQVIDDSQLQASTTAIAGAEVLNTSRTVQHWYGTTTDPHNGVTYGYNMVGADPNNCSGSACDVTIEADITPIIVNIQAFAGTPYQTYDGTAIVNATLQSPQFAQNDYGSTNFATAGASNVPRGPGGKLSQGDSGNHLQLEDATMRAQFNQTGSSNYHVRLHPNVLSPVTINVPQNQGTVLLSGRGVPFADIDIGWWSSQIKNLETKADPTHLPIYLTNSVMLYTGKSVFNCCVIGYHGTIPVGLGAGSGNSNGNAVVQTFAWASWVRPGIFARPNGGTDWALQDIHALSHEIAEWADDPFVNNTVEPWVTPTAPQYGCTGILETGDPVVAIGFTMGSNSYDQTPNPWTNPTNHNPSVSYDGYYHPEDEVFLPWYMRTAPNNVSEPTQATSANGGRYTLMGDLNPFPGFRQPATGC